MVRRRILEEPVSRLAIWSRRVALFSLVATLIGVIIVRSGALDVVPAVSTLAGALALAVVAILLALGAGIMIWKDGLGGFRQAASAVLIGLALIGYPAYLGVRAYQLPAIYDVTTDPIDPPQFDAIARLRPRDANPVTYQGLYAAQLRRPPHPHPPAAIRCDRAAAPARRQSGHLSGPLRGPAAACGLLGHRSGTNNGDAAGGVRR